MLSLSEALELNSQLPEIHYNLAVIFQTWGEWDFAAHHYQAAIAHQPSYAKAYFNWGVLNVNQGRYALAAACYQQAIAYQPDYLNAYLNLGSLLLHQKDEESAIIFYQRQLNSFPLMQDYTIT
ncbi:MAG: tetratricopeptide repeat protein [Synechococcales cyanobacterium RU_4_20]|nr:tetratricopeptide repeat protein [Synechococcales cyanobacterium RU_4_20]